MMDLIACTDQSKETDSLSHDTIVVVNNDSNGKASKNTCNQSPHATVMLPLGPVTPDSNKEIGDPSFNLYFSPLTELNIPQNPICFDTISNNGICSSNDCSTPQSVGNVVFDPFAPGPKDMMLAPCWKKPTSRLKFNVSRRLDFGSSSMDNIDTVSVSDDEMIEILYKNIVMVIISMQTKGVVAEASNVEWDSDDCKTPPLTPRINKSAETCPNAPIKRAGKSKNVDFGLCRKLQF